MSALDPTSRIHANTHRRELYFSIAGFWEPASMKAFLRDLTAAANPFIRDGVEFVAIGNLADFVPQDRETAAAIRDSLLLASQHGLTRFAVVSPSSLVKMQYRRITAGLDVEFFEDEYAAREWLGNA
ncbi:MAG: STAS/SEC14 domain-containing protein [Erythrobacter sp.]